MACRLAALMTVLALGTAAQAQEPVPFRRCSPTYMGRPNAAPQISLEAQPRELSAGGSTRVELRAAAKDPDGDKLRYSYFSTGGRISGGGGDPGAVWDLAGMAPGAYTASVEADDGRGCVAVVPVTVTVRP